MSYSMETGQGRDSAAEPESGLPGAVDQVTRRPIRFRVKRVAGVVGLVIIIAALVVTFHNLPQADRTFTVENIVVNNNFLLSSEEVLLFSGLSGRRELSSEDLHTAAAKLKEHPAIADLSYKRVGNELNINLVERRCLAVIRNSSGSLLYDVDENLNVIVAGNNLRCGDVPLISGDFLPEQDRFEQPELKRLALALKKIKENYPALSGRISELHFERSGELTMYTTGARLKVQLPGFLSSRAIQRLEASLAYLSEKKYLAGQLDLRGKDGLFMP